MQPQEVGQEFSSEKYFWGRPSSTHDFPYNAAKSGASNLGPTNPMLLAIVQKRFQMLQKLNPDTALQIPIELVTASASGLDPEISIRAAMYQVARISKARNLNTRKIQELIFTYSNSKYLNIYSLPRVNVILINLALDKLSKGTL